MEYTDDYDEEERRRRLEGWMSAQPLAMRRLDRSDREVAMLTGWYSFFEQGGSFKAVRHYKMVLWSFQ